MKKAALAARKDAKLDKAARKRMKKEAKELGEEAGGEEDVDGSSYCNWNDLILSVILVKMHCCKHLEQKLMQEFSISMTCFNQCYLISLTMSRLASFFSQLSTLKSLFW